MSNDEPLFDSDVDPKRIKSVADGLRRQGEFESARMLDSYAVMLAAAPQQAAEPFMYTWSNEPDKDGVFRKIPLYTRPHPAQDALGAVLEVALSIMDANDPLNAARLRKMRDAAIAQESGR